MAKTTPTRNLKTSAEKAIAALGVEQRHVDELDAKIEKLNEEHAALVDEIKAARVRRDYLAQNPDLPETNTDPIPGVDVEVAR